MDVVVVLDFAGPAAQRFEALGQFFLASWMEQGGKESRCQLHVVCIGEAAPAISRLAGLCRARVLRRKEVPGPDRLRNKLRAFEVDRTSDHLLLLDADVLWLASVESALAQLPGDAIALSYANDAHLSMSQWAYVYDALGLSLPEARCPVVNACLDKSRPGETLCYYNSGVVWTPWRFDLGSVWSNLIHRVPAIVQSNKEAMPLPPLALSDQPPLAVAVDILRRKGMKTVEVPVALHTRWQHICLGWVDVGDIVLAHNVGLFRRTALGDDLAGIRDYQDLTRSRMDTRGGTGLERARLSNYAEVLGDYLLLLHKKYLT